MEDRYRQRIIARLDKQRAKGVSKYGSPLEQSGLTMIQVLHHLAEELTDSLEYVERCIELEQQRVGQAYSEGIPQEAKWCKTCANHKPHRYVPCALDGMEYYRCYSNRFALYKPHEPICPVFPSRICYNDRCREDERIKGECLASANAMHHVPMRENAQQ